MNSSCAARSSLAQSSHGVRDRDDFGRPAFPVEPEHRRIQIVVQALVPGGEGQQCRGDLGAHVGDGGELLFRRFQSNDLHPQVPRRLGQELVDLWQIESFALRFAFGERGQDSQEPGLQVVRELGGIAETGDEFIDVSTVLRRDDALERVMIAIERAWPASPP